MPLPQLSMYKSPAGGDNVPCAPYKHFNLSLQKWKSDTSILWSPGKQDSFQDTGSQVFLHTKMQYKVCCLWSHRALLLWILFTKHRQRYLRSWERVDHYLCCSHHVSVSHHIVVCHKFPGNLSFSSLVCISLNNLLCTTLKCFIFIY